MNSIGVGVVQPPAGGKYTDSLDSEAVHERHCLCVATELMESMLLELYAFSGSDVSLRFALVTEGPAISEQLADLRGLVSQLSAARCLKNELERAKALVGPLFRRLDTLAENFEVRNS